MAPLRRKSLKECIELMECGKRMHGTISQIMVDFHPWEIRHCWIAFTLQEGKWDGAVYDSLPAAKKHTDEWTHCYYSFLAMGGISARDCEIFIDFHRQAREISGSQKDPNRVPIMSFTGGDIFRSAQQGRINGSLHGRYPRCRISHAY